jgi:hypothetical protein
VKHTIQCDKYKTVERKNKVLCTSSSGFKDEMNHNRFGAQQLYQKEMKHLRSKQKRNNSKKKHTCTLLCPKMETSRAHSSAIEGETSQQGEKNKFTDFSATQLP